MKPPGSRRRNELNSSWNVSSTVQPTLVGFANFVCARSPRSWILVPHSRKWELRTNGEYQIVIPTLRSAVEPNRRVQPDEERIAHRGRVAPFVAIRAAARHHVAMPSEDVVDLLFH